MGVPVSHWLAQGGGCASRARGGDAEGLQHRRAARWTCAGTLQQTWLRGADGRLYVADKAPGDVFHTGVYQGYEQRSARWARRPRALPTCWRRAPATVGDAGTLLISTRSAVLEGDLVGDTYQGTRQDRAPQSGLDGYSQSQRAARAAPAWWQRCITTRPRARSIPSWAPPATRWPKWCWARDACGGRWPGPGRRLAAGKQGQAVLDANQLNGFAGPAVRRGRTLHHRRCGLRGADGGEITLYAPDVDVKANLTSRGGLIQAGNVLYQPSFRPCGSRTRAGPGRQPEGAAARLGRRDAGRARGVWANLLRDADGLAGLPVRDGPHRCAAPVTWPWTRAACGRDRWRLRCVRCKLQGGKGG